MPIKIIRQDITKIECDAIVNAAKNSLLGGGGVDGAIHQAAGPKLLEECKTLGGCKTGEAKITYGYNLPAKYVIHTVGPIWQGGSNGEAELLASCYRNSLALAKECLLNSIAFPMISTGIYGYPKAEAFNIAMREAKAFLEENEMMIYLIVFSRESLEATKDFCPDIEQYINDNYVFNLETRVMPSASLSFNNSPDENLRHSLFRKKSKKRLEPIADEPKVIAPSPDKEFAPCATQDIAEVDYQCYAPSFDPDSYDSDLDKVLNGIVDESFSQMVFRKIDEQGITDPECYKRSNLDKKLFSKIKKPDYKPSKKTALALAIGLRLNQKEAEELLMKAGFAFNPSDMGDVIVKYFIEHSYYDIHNINMALYQRDQQLLGSF